MGLEYMNSADMPALERWAWVLGSSVVCQLLFVATWFFSSKFGPVRHEFRKFDFANKCDWCSRVPSVIHATVVLYFLWRENLFNVEWDSMFQSRNDLTALERNMCISAGYFLYDLMVVLISKMSLWQLFVFHHSTALWPLLSVLFNGCQNYTFFGTAFFFVEMTIVPLQLVHWGETLKAFDHWLVKLGYHLTFWLWLPFRLVLPVYLTYNGVWVVMAADDSVGLWQCKVPVGQGGFGIWIFCWLIFGAHIGPAYWKRIFKGQEPAQRKAPRQIEKEKEKAEREAAARAAAKKDKIKVPPPQMETSAELSPVASPILKTTL